MSCGPNSRRRGNPLIGGRSPVPLSVDFDMQGDVVADEVGAEEFTGAVCATAGGAVELQKPGEVLAVVFRGDTHGNWSGAAIQDRSGGTGEPLGGRLSSACRIDSAPRVAV